MKPLIRAFWPEGCIFLFFCAALIGGVWVFKALLAAGTEFGVGVIGGAAWAWLMDRLAEAARDTGKEFSEAWKRE